MIQNTKADIGVIGLAVMGENLAMNFLNHGFRTAVYNRTFEKTEKFISGRARGKDVCFGRTLAEFLDQLGTPRKILLMVKAGSAVDALLSELSGYLSPGDILIDGGNSLYTDTERRCEMCKGKQLRFIGCGISGGEEGALHGPSLMPGGEESAWPSVRAMLQTIAAKAPDGTPCCEWIGPGGAGHYVKMVHNGIEYADMQMISEAYDLLRKGAGLATEEIQKLFQQWNQTELESFLMEITVKILGRRDDHSEDMLLDRILDTAGQKGTGLWTARSGLELACAVPTIAEAVYARSLSAAREERLEGAELLETPEYHAPTPTDFPETARQALYASKICSYAQGFRLLHAAAHTYNWGLDYGKIASLWRGGCIIRARFLDRITEAFRRNPELSNLLFDKFFRKELLTAQNGWRRTVAEGMLRGIPLPAFSSALSFFDACRASRLPANLIQAQRDFFGAHTYERTDRPRGEFFHTQWSDGR